jgi:hypothetical protein
MAAGKVVTELVATDSNLRSVLSRGTGLISGFGSHAKHILGEAFSFGLGMIGVQSFEAVIGHITSLLKDSYQEFVAAEDASRKLNSALSLTGQGQYLAQLKEVAENVQRVTTYENDALLPIMAMGIQFGIAAQDMETYIKAAIGLRTASGGAMSLEAAMRLLMKASGGNFTMLQRMIPALANLGTAGEKLAYVNDLITRGWQQAQDESTTTTGKIEQLKNRFGDLQEKLIGALKPLIDDVLAKFDEWVSSVENNEPKILSFFTDLTTGIENAANEMKFLCDLTQQTLNQLSLFSKNFNVGAAKVNEEITWLLPFSTQNDIDAAEGGTELARNRRDEILKMISDSMIPPEIKPYKGLRPSQEAMVKSLNDVLSSVYGPVFGDVAAAMTGGMKKPGLSIRNNFKAKQEQAAAEVIAPVAPQFKSQFEGLESLWKRISASAASPQEKALDKVAANTKDAAKSAEKTATETEEGNDILASIRDKLDRPFVGVYA